jgi:MFS family permease
MAEAGGTTSAGRIRAVAAAFPRPFWLLTAGWFVYVLGYECGFPFESIYLNEKLGISLTAIGLIYGVTQLCGLPAQIAGGAAADRVGRRPVLLLGIMATTVLFLGLAFVHSVPLVVALIAFEAAFGWGMFQMSSNAVVSDVVPEERRTEGYSIARTAASGGIVVGPLLGGLLLRHDPSYRWPFIAGGAICATFFVIALVWLPETRPAAAAARESVRATFAGYRAVLRDRRLLTFAAVTLLPLYCHGQFLMTFPILLKDTVGVSTSTVGLLYSLYALCNVLVQYPLGRRLRHADRMKVLAAASTFMGVGLSGAAFAPRGVATAAFVVVVSFGTALLMPFSVTVISHLAPLRLRGRYMGAWTLVWTAGVALGPIFGGLAMDRLGGRGAYALVLAAGLIGAVLYLLLSRRRTMDAAAT